MYKDLFESGHASSELNDEEYNLWSVVLGFYDTSEDESEDESESEYESEDDNAPPSETPTVEKPLTLDELETVARTGRFDQLDARDILRLKNEFNNTHSDEAFEEYKDLFESGHTSSKLNDEEYNLW